MPKDIDINLQLRVLGSTMLLSCAIGCTTSTPVATHSHSSGGVCGDWSRQDVHAILKRKEDVQSISGLVREPFVARPNARKVAAARAREEKVIGVRILVHPREGMSIERLQAAIDCDRALAAHDGTGRDSTCPFEVEGSTATVHSAEGAFEVDITSEEPETAAHAFELTHSLFFDDSSAGNETGAASSR